MGKNVRSEKSSEFSFTPGQIFRRETTLFRIDGDEGAFYRLENSRTLEKKLYPKLQLQLDYASELIAPATVGDEEKARQGGITLNDDAKLLHHLPLDMCSPAAQLHVRSVMACINGLRKLGYESLTPKPLLQIEYDRLWQRIKVENPDFVHYELRTIYDWSLVLDRSGGDPRAILPLFSDRGGRGKSRLPEITQECVKLALYHLRTHTDLKLRPCLVEELTLNLLVQKVGGDQAPLLNVSRSSASRALEKEFTPFQILVRNKGKAYAEREYRDTYPRDRAERPLEVVEFDDKDSRVFLIDERSGLPFGRGFVTAGIDQATLVPMGFSVSERHRSTWSAICAVTNSILPKDPNAPEFGEVTSAIEFMGKPGIALFDNATYNHVTEIDLAVYEMQITAAWAKPYTPTEKSCIENFNGRMDGDFFRLQPGYAGAKGDRDALNEGSASANISTDDFVRRLMRWAYDDYCNTPGEDGFTPRQRWHSQMRLVEPRFPVDIYRLKIAPTLRHSVAFRPVGIRFAGLIYQSDRLVKLRRNIGATAKVEFRYDPRDMSRIYVLDPFERQLFIVPSAHPEYTQGLTLYQHRLIRKMARLRKKFNPSIPELLKIREDLRILVEQTRFSTKKKERAFSKKVGSVPEGETNTAKCTDSEKVVMTDLEAQVADIDDIEMEMGEEGWDVPELI